MLTRRSRNALPKTLKLILGECDILGILRLSDIDLFLSGTEPNKMRLTHMLLTKAIFFYLLQNLFGREMSLRHTESLQPAVVYVLFNNALLFLIFLFWHFQILHPHRPILARLQQHLNPALRTSQLRLARIRQLHPTLKQSHAILERQIPSLKLLDHLLQLC